MHFSHDRTYTQKSFKFRWSCKLPVSLAVYKWPNVHAAIFEPFLWRGNIANKGRLIHLIFLPVQIKITIDKHYHNLFTPLLSHCYLLQLCWQAHEDCKGTIVTLINKKKRIDEGLKRLVEACKTFLLWWCKSSCTYLREILIDCYKPILQGSPWDGI